MARTANKDSPEPSLGSSTLPFFIRDLVSPKLQNLYLSALTQTTKLPNS